MISSFEFFKTSNKFSIDGWEIESVSVDSLGLLSREPFQVSLSNYTLFLSFGEKKNFATTSYIIRAPQMIAEITGFGNGRIMVYEETLNFDFNFQAVKPLNEVIVKDYSSSGELFFTAKPVERIPERPFPAVLVLGLFTLLLLFRRRN